MTKIHNGIQYLGLPGITQESLDGIMRLLQYDDRIERARILSASDTHGFLLTLQGGDLVAIKAGFGSGYNGEGSRKFSYALELLDAHKIEIDEYDVGKAFLNRLDSNTLTVEDMDALDQMRPVRPQRYHDYISDRHFHVRKAGALWEKFRPVVPFGIIDRRITDLAVTFWDNPDDKLMTGYRRLEDIVRERTSLDEHGAKLFMQAFNPTSPKLSWEGIGNKELAARASMFSSIYSAHRNPRAHKEIRGRESALLSEFLLLNHLFLLESEAV